MGCQSAFYGHCCHDFLLCGNLSPLIAKHGSSSRRRPLPVLHLKFSRDPVHKGWAKICLPCCGKW